MGGTYMRKSSYVEIRDTRLYIERIGEGYPIIILHGGFGFDMRFFDDCLDPLGEYFELIYVDLRGQGLSDEVSLETITLDNMALDVVELAKMLDVTQPAASQHIKILRNVGLLEPKKEGYHVYYYINKDVLRAYKKDFNALYDMAFQKCKNYPDCGAYKK